MSCILFKDATVSFYSHCIYLFFYVHSYIPNMIKLIAAKLIMNHFFFLSLCIYFFHQATQKHCLLVARHSRFFFVRWWLFLFLFFSKVNVKIFMLDFLCLIARIGDGGRRTFQNSNFKNVVVKLSRRSNIQFILSNEGTIGEVLVVK